MTNENKITTFSQDMDGYMIPDEDGKWVVKDALGIK